MGNESYIRLVPFVGFSLFLYLCAQKNKRIMNKRPSLAFCHWTVATPNICVTERFFTACKTTGIADATLLGGLTNEIISIQNNELKAD